MVFPILEDEPGKVKLDELMAADTQLLGRVTYEGFAAAWPSMENDEAGFGKKMNSMPKVVVSTTLKKAGWNNSRLVKGDIAAEITALKKQPGKDMVIFGTAR